MLIGGVFNVHVQVHAHHERRGEPELAAEAAEILGKRTTVVNVPAALAMIFGSDKHQEFLDFKSTEGKVHLGVTLDGVQMTAKADVTLGFAASGNLEPWRASPLACIPATVGEHGETSRALEMDLQAAGVLEKDASMTFGCVGEGCAACKAHIPPNQAGQHCLPVVLTAVNDVKTAACLAAACAARFAPLVEKLRRETPTGPSSRLTPIEQSCARPCHRAITKRQGRTGESSCQVTSPAVGPAIRSAPRRRMPNTSKSGGCSSARA